MLISEIVCGGGDISRIRHRAWLYILGVFSCLFFEGMVWSCGIGIFSGVRGFML